MIKNPNKEKYTVLESDHTIFNGPYILFDPDGVKKEEGKVDFQVWQVVS